MSMEFKKLRGEDLEGLKPWFRQRSTLCCESHPAYHLLWNYYYETRYCADETGLVWLQRVDYDSRATTVPICSLETMQENFRRLQDYFTRELGEKMHMYLVDQEALEAIRPDPARYEVIADVDSYDYIYEGENLRQLPGRRYAKKKNMVTRFLRDYEARAEYVALREDDLDEILEFSGRWFQKKDCEDDLNRLDSEEKGIGDAIRLAQTLGLQTAGVRIDGRLEAFTIGSCDPAADMAVIHVEKANPQIRGLYHYIAWKFLRECYPDVRYVNREDDMGFLNLRKTKESYYPVLRGIKYTILER